MTTSGAARCHDILQRVKPRVIIVEEAAEVLEAHIISSLNTSCEHLILIGSRLKLLGVDNYCCILFKHILTLNLLLQEYTMPFDMYVVNHINSLFKDEYTQGVNSLIYCWRVFFFCESWAAKNC